MIGGLLNYNESWILWNAGITIGQQATIWRDYEHTSTLYPRPHTDAIFVVCEDYMTYRIIDKYHVT